MTSGLIPTYDEPHESSLNIWGRGLVVGQPASIIDYSSDVEWVRILSSDGIVWVLLKSLLANGVKIIDVCNQ